MKTYKQIRQLHESRYIKQLDNLINSEAQIIWFDIVDDYSGCVKILFRDTNNWCSNRTLPNGEYDSTKEYYFAEYGYGSCSGCDEWESESYSLTRLNLEMAKNIVIIGNLKNFLEYIALNKEIVLSDDLIKEIKESDYYE